MEEKTARVAEMLFVDLKYEYCKVRKKISEAMERVLQQAAFIMGEDVSLFERASANYCGVKHSIRVTKGGDALMLALKALGLQPGDKALLPMNTDEYLHRHCGSRCAR